MTADSRIACKRSKVIRDPIHGLIDVGSDPIIRDLIDTAEFQRLRRVRQMGVGHLVYPGAVHTRFSHSIGCYHITKQIIRSLHDRYSTGGQTDISRILNPENDWANNLRIAALLHDVGHGPFSHAFEHAFPNFRLHEERTKEIIKDPESEIHQVLLSHSMTEDQIRQVWKLLDSCEYPFLHDMLSSRIDADRMDYLLRDSYSAGVSYGHYDQPWLLNSFCIGIEDSNGTGAGLRSCRLCLDADKGTHSAAQLIIARSHMSHQVYYHHATRSWEAHLVCLFHEVSELARRDKLPKGTMPIIAELFGKESGLGNYEFLLLDDSCFEAHFNLWARASGAEHARLAKFSKAFISRKKCMKCVSLSSHSRDVVALLEKLLTENVSPPGHGWVIDTTDFNSYKIPKEELAQEDPESYKEQLSSTAIFLSDGTIDKPCKPIQRCLPLFNGSISQTVPVYFLFYEDTFADKVESVLKECV